MTIEVKLTAEIPAIGEKVILPPKRHIAFQVVNVDHEKRTITLVSDTVLLLRRRNCNQFTLTFEAYVARRNWKPLGAFAD